MHLKRCVFFIKKLTGLENGPISNTISVKEYKKPFRTVAQAPADLYQRVP